MNILTDPAAEKAVLASCYRYGRAAFVDIIDLIIPSTFTVEYNEILFHCLRHIFEKLELDKPDVATLHSAANDLGLAYKIQKSECALHIKQIIEFDCEPKTARKLAAKIRKLEIARLLRKQLEDAQDKILEVTGNETITNILGLAENAVFNFSDVVNADSEDPNRVDGDYLTSHIQEIIDNPVSQIGISSGMKRWDACIGGGLRNGTINVIGARPKGFKSGIAINTANFVAKMNVPVLYLDTEMNYNDQINRLLSSRTGIGLTDLETGQFAKREFLKSKLSQEIQKIKKEEFPFYHKTIAGTPFEEQLSIMRRWLFKEVGVRGNATSKPCLIVYDYLKLMSSNILKNLQEYQALGFMMSSLHNFCVKYQVPVLTFVQLNRDGISREGSDVVSQSDRIAWLCSNISIFKKKDAAEIEMDGEESGNYKLVPLHVRHGPGLEEGDYINFHVKKWCMQIREGKTKNEVFQEKEDIEEIDERISL